MNQNEFLENTHMTHAVKGNQNTINSDAKCHYVTYVLGKNGHIIELDGRTTQPVVKGKCDDPNDLLSFPMKVSEIIQGYMKIS